MVFLYVISGKGRFSGSQQLWGLEELMDSAGSGKSWIPTLATQH